MSNQIITKNNNNSNTAASSSNNNNNSSNKKRPFFEKWRSLFNQQDGSRFNAECGKEGHLVRQHSPDTFNVYDLFLHGLKKSPTAPCFGWRNGDHYESVNYETVNIQILRLAKALRLITNLKKQDFVGLYSANSSQWMTTAMASASSGFVLVPLYDTLGAESTCHIVNEVGMTVLFVDTVAACRRIFETLSAKANPLRVIVLLGAIGQFKPEPIPDDLLNKGKLANITIYNVQTLVAEAVDMSENPQLVASFSPKLDDLYMVQYTSGTTGVPKGVMLTHGAFVANAAAIQSLYSAGSMKGYTLDDCGELTTLHYLPLAHSYGQLLALSFLYNGGTTAFFSGNVANIANDAALLRPTYMPLVPRLMNKVYTKVMAEIGLKGSLASKVFWFAYERKRELVRKGIITRSSIWDRIVFRKLQAKLGGRVKFMMTASAPVGPEVLEFWRVVFGTHIMEAYGQTECTALVTAAVHPDGGNVGHPVTCNKLKLADIPEMDLLASSGRGEVCVKGPNVMKGYFKRPEMTVEVIDADGWLHTGDIGEFTSDGSLRIVDRKKHIFKLAQGEYIAPEKIESVYSCCPLVGQVFVDGNGLQWFTVAVIVPDRVEAEQWAAKNGMGENADFAAICANKHFARHVLETLIALGRSKGLNQLEQVRNIYLHPELFSIENGLLTPSHKNRRPQLRAYFKPQVDKLYRDGPLEPNK